MRNYRWKTKRYQRADQSHARNGFPLTEHESKELFHQYCRPGGTLSRQSGREYETARLEMPTLLDTFFNNERDFVKVADALIIQHPRIHFRQGRTRLRRNQIQRQLEHSSASGERQASTPAVENWEQVPVTQTSL